MHISRAYEFIPNEVIGSTRVEAPSLIEQPEDISTLDSPASHNFAHLLFNMLMMIQHHNILRPELKPDNTTILLSPLIPSNSRVRTNPETVTRPHTSRMLSKAAIDGDCLGKE